MGKSNLKFKKDQSRRISANKKLNAEKEEKVN
jgi:hypothetical protein